MIIEKDFSCMKGNMTVRGRELYDDSLNERKDPVIISHGFTSCMKYTRDYGVFLAEQGYHAYIFDFCGGGFETVSDGSFEDYMTPLTEVDDLKTVISYVQGQPDVNADRLILIGCSQGGFVSALTAAGLREQIFGLILLYPALCIPDDARAGSMQIIRFDSTNIPPHIGEGRMRISGAYASSVLHMNVFDDIRYYKGHVLLVHGTDDQIVSYGYSLAAESVYQRNGADVTLKLIENAPHGFRGKDFDVSCEIIASWLKGLQ